MKHLILFGLIVGLAVMGCGGSEGMSAGGDGGSDGAGGVAAEGGQGGSGGAAGQGGTGGASAAGGAGGGAVREITSSIEWIDSELAYQSERCQCQGSDPISESACIALADNLPFSDRQNTCFDDIVINEELMTLENRFECLVNVNLDAAACVAAVDPCDEGEIAACEMLRTTGKLGCPTPFADVIPLTSMCFSTGVDDGVDAFLDSRGARCDCLAGCESPEPEPSVVGCMVETLGMQVAMLGPDGPKELACATKSWRRLAVCFENEVSCDGAVTACSDIPPMLCAISGAILDECLSQ